jgi:5-methylcytosine-specific restriction endonuclease McrA
MDKVLVLNADYTPLNVTSVYRGFNLVVKGKAEILKSGEKPIVTETKEYSRPLIIRLLNYVKYRIHKLKINRHRIFRRDNYECVYCGSSKTLTIDHVIPKSGGGENTWVNLVTCCSHCNKVKGNKTPSEVGMKIIQKPFEPSFFSDAIHPNIESVWTEFQKKFL